MSSLVNLSFLNLEKCSLNSLNITLFSNMFHDLIKLTELNIYSNELASIDANTFDGLRSLRLVRVKAGNFISDNTIQNLNILYSNCTFL